MNRSVARTRSRISCSASVALSSPHSSRWAVFVSGNGSLLHALWQSLDDESVPGELACVVTDNPSCAAAALAMQHNIPVLRYPNGHLTEHQLVHELQSAHRVSFIVLAGYVKRVPEPVLNAYKHRALNAHPALLPSFGGKGYYGRTVHRAVIDSGAKLSGTSVHFASSEYDDGPIIAQQPVPVLPSDDDSSLAARVGEQERVLLPAVCAALALGCVSVQQHKQLSHSEDNAHDRTVVYVDTDFAKSLDPRSVALSLGAAAKPLHRYA